MRFSRTAPLSGTAGDQLHQRRGAGRSRRCEPEELPVGGRKRHLTQYVGGPAGLHHGQRLHQIGDAVRVVTGAAVQRHHHLVRFAGVTRDPTSPAIAIRLTSGIAVDVIRSARESLLIASFAAYDITEIVAELRAAAERNVRIDLFLEESTAAARAFGPLGEKVRIWHRADGADHTSLHAKVIAADRHTALLGSANLTGRGLSRNVEIGVILHDSRTVGRLVDHLRWLTGPDGLLRRA
ncbi:phospholipase D-like domain-containing protein [Streptomyces sp. NPDC018000]|uniref:phospholipase D-like domain-containing protein n=1 Tax=Streptomyces sp. NPDC018000 TaxID=3365028 RepID=UPI00379AAC09